MKAFLKAPDAISYKPLLFDGENLTDIQRLIEVERPILHDFLASQIKELHKIRTPETKMSEEELGNFYKQWSLSNDEETYGVYVYYPWSNRLVHLVHREEFIELRTSRNKHKITQDEQDYLASRVMGVIGLSVGQSVALTLAMERTCGTLRIADYDSLELTNLNRIRAGVASLGLPKTMVVAREIAELDPFIEVEVFSEGITEDNIDSFLEGDKKLDLLLEECDSMPVKVLSRLKARKLGIPVLMDTSDRGMIDVERFDIDDTLPLFHGLCPISNMEQLNAMSPEEIMNLMMTMVDFENLSDRMKYSFGELGKSLSTWPQLASDVISGGGHAAALARMIILGEEVPSKRYYFDISQYVKAQ